MKKVDTQSTNKLYDELQERHKGSSALVNGYRLHKYFIREQELIMSLINSSETKNADTFLDIACGSGLMTLPLFEQKKTVIGLDFNHTSCLSAKDNMTHCVQGDAFKLPFKKDSFDAVINCQFLNQQKPEDITRFLEECYAVLKPYGRLILIWRNGSALIHKAAHAAYTILDKITNNPSFPVFDHPLPEITRQASSIGFETQTQFVTFPLLNWKSDRLNSFSAKVIGASAVLVLQKNI